MSSSEERSPSSAGSASGSFRSGESLEQVRDLLFGSEMRAMDRRLQRVEERVTREVSALRSDLKQRLESIQNNLTSELEGLSRAISEEQLERSRGTEAVNSRIEAAANAIETRLEELRAEAAIAHEELRVSALEDGLAIRAETATARQADHKRMARMFAQLARFMDEAANTSQIEKP